jgi:hypothetical protein
MSISNYAELKILDHTTGRAAWTIPTNVYVQLHTGDAGEEGTSSVATETTRKVAAWSAASSGSIATSATLEWTDVAATETSSRLTSDFAAVTVVNTTADTSVLTYSLSSPVANERYELTAFGTQLNNSGGNVNYQYFVKVGATTVVTTDGKNFARPQIVENGGLLLTYFLTVQQFKK